MLQYAKQIGKICADYRFDDGVRVDAERALLWAGQFEAVDREFVLSETAHILSRMYWGRERLNAQVDQFIERFGHQLTAARWHRRQLGGQSQEWLIGELERRGLTEAPGAPRVAYVDDIIFSGGRASQDILACLEDYKLGGVRQIDVYSLIRHLASESNFQHHSGRLLQALRQAKIDIQVFQLNLVIDGRFDTDNSTEVLRPVELPAGGRFGEYCAKLSNFRPRTVGHPRQSAFTSDEARQRYELVMFNAGCLVREQCPNLRAKVLMKPLGATTFLTPGFGALTVTHRNCPNNCPLAWWAGAPWIPLFERRTNLPQAIIPVRFGNHFGFADDDIPF
jgi:hypothetical protein